MNCVTPAYLGLARDFHNGDNDPPRVWRSASVLCINAPLSRHQRFTQWRRLSVVLVILRRLDVCVSADVDFVFLIFTMLCVYVLFCILGLTMAFFFFMKIKKNSCRKKYCAEAFSSFTLGYMRMLNDSTIFN